MLERNVLPLAFGFALLLATFSACQTGAPASAERPLAAADGQAPAVAPLAEPRTDGSGSRDVCSELLAGSEVPRILAPDRAVRFVAFGDFGDGGRDQLAAAAAMARFDAREPFDFGVTLGDNFYPRGIDDPASPRWQSQWEKPYGPLGIRFYASLGNHDRYDSASPGGEYAYSKKSATWCLPKPYHYTFAAGPVQLFALDTDLIAGDHPDAAATAEQKTWLDRALAASTARWKIVYGHHPVYSSGGHGDSKEMAREVLPILEKRGVALYLAGHDHHLEIQRPAGGVHFAIVGAGGHDLHDTDRRIVEKAPCSAWARDRTPGFVVVDGDAARLRLRFVDAHGTVRREWTIADDASANCPRPGE